jgi:YfiH family protein
MWTLENDLWRDTDFPFCNAVSTRACGNLRDPAVRAAFCRARDIDPAALVCAEQVHGTRVALVDQSRRGQTIAGVDGLITRDRGVYLGIFTADCLAVFLADPSSGTIALVHAGWRGLAGGIIGNAIDAMVRECGATPATMRAAVSPHIQQCCFQVGEDVKAAFGLAGTPGDRLDLGAIACDQLSRAGVRQVSANGRCTCHEDRLFFSYRRDRTSGRQLSLAGNGPNVRG